MKPVALPPGRAKLATKPLPTGSETFAKMMGMVRVCCSIAAVVGVFCVRMRSGCRETSSLANRCIACANPADKGNIERVRQTIRGTAIEDHTISELLLHLSPEMVA